MFGLGAALAYTPSLAVLGHHFERYLGVANGFVTAGSSAFTMAMPFIIERVSSSQLGLRGAFCLLAALAACIVPCALLFSTTTTTTPKSVDKERVRRPREPLLRRGLWSNARYAIWALTIPVALLGYFVPYVHANALVDARWGSTADGKLPVVCLGAASGVGRLVFGAVADLPHVNRVRLQQLSLAGYGALTMALPFCPTFGALLAACAAMGLFDGCFVSLLGPIAFDLCGKDGAAQAIGFLLGLCSVPLTLGPPLAGLLYDAVADYQLPYLLAGVPPLLGTVALFAIDCVKSAPDAPRDKYLQPLAMPEDVGAKTLLDTAKHPEGRCTRCLIHDIRLWERQKDYNTLVL